MSFEILYKLLKIARETDAAVKNRQVHVDLFKHKKKLRTDGKAEKDHDPEPPHAQPETQPSVKSKPKTYKTTLSIPINQPSSNSPNHEQVPNDIHPEIATNTYKTSRVEMKKPNPNQHKPPIAPKPMLMPASNQKYVHNKEVQVPDENGTENKQEKPDTDSPTHPKHHGPEHKAEPEESHNNNNHNIPEPPPLPKSKSSSELNKYV